MKFLLVLCWLSSVCVAAQDSSFYKIPVGDTSLLFTFAEQMPRYNHRDGDRELIKQLRNSIDFSNCKTENFPSGKITMSFVLDVDGRVINPQIVKGDCDTANKSLTEKVTTFSFIPGTQNGKRVRVKYLVPIIVELR
jgi:protein TonB